MNAMSIFIFLLHKN